MSWSLEQLNAFVLSAELGSFSAAARRLNKAQSRISTAVADLEIDLGVSLFDRSGHRPMLTPAGEKLRHQAESILKQNERLMAQAAQLSSNQKPQFSVALDESLPLKPFEDLLVRVAEQFPFLTLDLLNGTRQDIARWVEEGAADLGVLFHFSPLPSSVDFVSLASIQQRLIVSMHHPLAQLPSVTLTDLMEYRQLVIKDRLPDQQSRPISNQYWWIDSYYYITSMVCQGIGWGLVPDHVVDFPWFENALVTLNVPNLPQALGMEMGLIKRRNCAQSDAEQWFCQRLTEVMKNGYSPY